MDIGSIFLILGLLVLVGLYISRPLLENKSVAVSQEDHDISALLAERDRLLGALQELDFDYALGKIPEGDYPAQRAALVQRGADVLRKLDEMQPGVAPGDVDERIEMQIAARRADAARVPVEVGGNGSATTLKPAAHAVKQDDELEALIADRRRVRKEKSAGFCPQCGDPVQKSDRFCPKCGKKLA
jgi:rubrerythrin